MIKNLKKSWKPKNLKKLNKFTRADIVYDAIPSLVDLVANPKKGTKFNEILLNEEHGISLLELVISEKFRKSIKLIMKDDAYNLDETFAMFINAVISSAFDKIPEDVIEEYTIVVTKLLKKKVKKASKKSGLNELLVQELLIILPDASILERKNRVSMYTDRMLNKCYGMVKNTDLVVDVTVKKLKKFFTFVAGEELLPVIATGILLQKKVMISSFDKAQLEIWNLASTFALETLENADKKELDRCMKYYANMLKFPGSRRLELTTLSEDFPRLSKAALKFIKVDEKEKETK